MNSMKRMKSAFRIAFAAALVVLVLAYAIVQFQQNLLRWRAERLMDDMHRVRLYQSNWVDAQRMMDRWGAWGQYDGSCTAKDCRYSIQLTDGSERAARYLSSDWRERLIRLNAYSLYRWLGGRYTVVQFAFIVQDGAILRTEFYVNVQVPPKLLDFEDEGYVLIVGAKSQQALSDTEGGGHVKGSADELAQHPYFKAGRPGGCENCLMVGITYSTRTPQAQVEELTSFDMSCLTRFFSCKMPEDLLPAAKEWHIYHDDEQYAIDQQSKSMLPQPCDIPLWALARDSGTVLVVDDISVSQVESDDYKYELAKAQLVTLLKGTPHWPVGSKLNIHVFGGRMNFLPFQLAEHLAPGKRYLILPSETVYGAPTRYSRPDDDPSDDPQIGLPRCGVWEDTPENRRELEKGFAQNDNLRGPELR
jgi:hypothetical protein